MPNTDHLPSKWLTEAILREVDPAAGAVIRQLTCQTAMATSIYCEDPFCSQECHRLVVLRSHNTGKMLQHDGLATSVFHPSSSSSYSYSSSVVLTAEYEYDDEYENDYHRRSLCHYVLA